MTASARELRAVEESVEAVGVSEGNFRYQELKDGTLEITGYAGDGAELETPSEIDGKRVTSIGEGAFFMCANLTNVTIPGSVTSIGRYTFSSF